jgi:topoisomerase-4 subunit A
MVFFDETKNIESMPKKLRIELIGRCTARIKDFEFDLSELTVGSRNAKGATVTAYPVKAVKRA